MEVEVNIRPMAPGDGAHCMKCKKPAMGDYGVTFPELEGAPFICSRCVYQALMTETFPTPWIPEWRSR